jgi:NitT/TauT family transport system substrate-binding protein
MTVALLIGCTPTVNDNADTGTGGGAESGSLDESITIRLGGLKGPTSMGMVKLLQDAQTGDSFNNYEFLLAGSADEVTPRLINGSLDIAAVPANLAAVLYNNTGGKVKLLAVNTLGVVYIVEKGETVHNLADLKGKTIQATARGSSPEYVLKYLLRENGLDPERDVIIDWKTEPTEVVSLMSQDGSAVAMLPQPYVTVAQGAIDNLRIAVDLTKEWEALDNGSKLLTGVLVVRSDFLEQYPEQVDKFLDEYHASTAYVNDNNTEAAALIEEFGIVKAAVAEKALPYCNIVCFTGDEMKAAMEGYLQVLYKENPQSIGGKLPDNDFYYGR